MPKSKMDLPLRISEASRILLDIIIGPVIEVQSQITSFDHLSPSEWGGDWLKDPKPLKPHKQSKFMTEKQIIQTEIGKLWAQWYDVDRRENEDKIAKIETLLKECTFIIQPEDTSLRPSLRLRIQTSREDFPCRVREFCGPAFSKMLSPNVGISPDFNLDSSTWDALFSYLRKIGVPKSSIEGDLLNKKEKHLFAQAQKIQEENQRIYNSLNAAYETSQEKEG